MMVACTVENPVGSGSDDVRLSWGHDQGFMVVGETGILLILGYCWTDRRDESSSLVGCKMNSLGGRDHGKWPCRSFLTVISPRLG